MPVALLLAVFAAGPTPADAAADSPALPPTAPAFSRAPLQAKPYARLPLGAVRPEGWLRDELRRMAGGMTGHLDEWYPEVCGPRNAWLGGDGDTWERGPYWVDGLLPLAVLLDDDALLAKATPWVEWTLANQRENGQIGPRELADADRTRPAPPGAQVYAPLDWWPRMVMLKILRQYHEATGDPRVLDCLTRYFRFQLDTLPDKPLHAPGVPGAGSWWAAQRGGDNLQVVLWLYNVTGDAFLLELADLLEEQTVPTTAWFVPGPENRIVHRADRNRAMSLHCVNLAQMFKTPAVAYQRDGDPARLDALRWGLRLIDEFHGQPHGVFGGDEMMHGDAPDRGSELCSAVEFMFSLEAAFEATGDVTFADRLERIAFNALPTQVTDDHRFRQYFQQTNQVRVTRGAHSFFDDEPGRLTYSLLGGYPCCTCNLHQGWPKFAAHLWMASADGGLAAVAYAPAAVTARVGPPPAAGADDDRPAVTLRTTGGYPFRETVTVEVTALRGPDGTDRPDAAFPLHLRVPAWADGATVTVTAVGEGGGEPEPAAAGGMHVLTRTWRVGDAVTLRLPMRVRTSSWYHRARAVERGPLVFALDVEPELTETVEPPPAFVPDGAVHRGDVQAEPAAGPGGRWNVALAGGPTAVRVEEVGGDEIPPNPWTRETAPVRLTAAAVPLPDWTVQRNSAAPPPLSPVEAPAGPGGGPAAAEAVTLLPYGATTLRVAAFPWIDPRADVDLPAGLLKFAAVSASHTWGGDSTAALRQPGVPDSAADRSRPRWTSWPQVGAPQWVEIELDRPTRVRTVAPYWYDDAEGIDPPTAWHVSRPVPDAAGGETWERVSPVDPPGPAVTGRYDARRFEPFVTDRLRLELTAPADKALGLLSVRIEGDPAP